MRESLEFCRLLLLKAQVYSISQLIIQKSTQILKSKKFEKCFGRFSKNQIRDKTMLVESDFECTSPAAGVFLLLLSLLCFLALVVSLGVSPRLILSLGTDMGVSGGAGGSAEAGLVAGTGVAGGGAAEGGGAGGGAGEEVLST